MLSKDDNFIHNSNFEENKNNASTRPLSAPTLILIKSDSSLSSTESDTSGQDVFLANFKHVESNKIESLSKRNYEQDNLEQTNFISGLTPFCISSIPVEDTNESYYNHVFDSLSPKSNIIDSSVQYLPSRQYTSYENNKTSLISKLDNIRTDQSITSENNHVIEQFYNLGAESTSVICKSCYKKVNTIIEYRAGIMTVVKCALLAIFG